MSTETHQTSPCEEHHDNHEGCTNHCGCCCHGSSNVKRVVYFILLLVAILIISTLIIGKKAQSQLPLPEKNQKSHLLLLGDSRCQTCAPMFEVFSKLKTLSPDRYNYKAYDKADGKFPFQIAIEPTIILLDSALNETSRYTGVQTLESLTQQLK